MTVIVQRRYGGEQLDIREFVRPKTFMVQELLASLGPQVDDNLLWGWVMQHIHYPPGPAGREDLHEETRYIGGARRVNRTTDYWNFPSETLRDRLGDCDDAAILLVSLLRNLYGPQEVYATIGYYENFGHVWTVRRMAAGWRVYETTYPRPVSPTLIVWEHRFPYRPVLRFNDDQVWVVREEPLPQQVREWRKHAVTGV